MSKEMLLIRADTNVAIGTGHVMRCLALAQAWQDSGGEAIFAMVDYSLSVCERLQGESIEIVRLTVPAGSEEDARETAALAREHSAVWIVVDGYCFGADYQRVLKSAGLKVLFVDDYGHSSEYGADIVLNQNVSAAERAYEKRLPQTRLLLGPRYCLLRREFQEWRDWKRKIEPVGHRVLVTMGGSDPENFTRQCIDALALIKNDKLEATVVIGGNNPNAELLERAVSASGRKIDIRRDASNMAELMAWADVAVSGAGSTCWEICLLGLPAILINLAGNQLPIAQELHRRGCAVHLGDRHVSAAILAQELSQVLSSYEDRRRMSRQCRELVDGRGAARVVETIRHPGLRLRPANEEDCRLLWEWANDSRVRAASFSSEPISWETHVAWFAKKIRQDSCRIWIAEDDGETPVGQIRLDTRSDGESEIHVSVSAARRGQGLAAPLIRLAAQSALNGGGCMRLHAFIRLDNVASLKAFENVGFKRIGIEQVQGNEAVHLICEGN